MRLQQLEIRPYRDRVTKIAPAEAQIFYHQAPYEADSEVVYLCNNLEEHEVGATLSPDGDLFAYAGAYDAPVSQIIFAHVET